MRPPPASPAVHAVHERTRVLVPTIAALLLCTGVLGGYALRVARKGRASLARHGDTPGTVLFPAWWMEAFVWALHAPARALARRRVSPDAITLAALALAVCSTPLLATGRFAIGAMVVLAAAALDGLDGPVAREQQLDGPRGAVLDSFVDRIADAAPLVGLALFYRARVETLLIPMAALIASSLVSYARAKADIYALRLPQGLMRRHERVAYLVAALLVAPFAPTLRMTGGVPFPIALAGAALIAGVSLGASILLLVRTRRALLPGAIGSAAARDRELKDAASSRLR